MKLSLSTIFYTTALATLSFSAALCAQQHTMPMLKGNETVWLLTAKQQLVQVNAQAPQTVLKQQSLKGINTGEQIVGIDYRVAYGVLFALSDQGQLYTVNTTSGQATAVGNKLPAGTLKSAQFGFDFNPAADRIRVVNALGQNLRLHPETGALAATDPDLAYAAVDSHAGKVPNIVAAAYTYDQQDAKVTSNYAIDIGAGNLVTQGTLAGVTPSISPNTGQLFTVGQLGIPDLQQVSFDISDINNIGLVALTTDSQPSTMLYQIDLASGQTHLIGQLIDGSAILGMAIEP
ncbi:DUF4394 domain-containing protein [Alishewanella sp. HL-SH06]|uniref:DUF4394 domain-containing protein n=1 Tax=Alishewanella sp. HL-SH06 TaxID=3461144 RepID=UPI004041178A